jgi:hypothetical protein
MIDGELIAMAAAPTNASDAAALVVELSRRAQAGFSEAEQLEQAGKNPPRLAACDCRRRLVEQVVRA